jgi:hypothetical protein
VVVFLESSAPAGLGELRSAVEAIAKDPDSDRKIIYLFHPDQSAESFRRLESMASQFGFNDLQTWTEPPPPST